MLAPDRPEASAVDLEWIATHPDAPDAERVRIASDLCWIPVTHPLREMPEQRADADGKPATVYVDHVLAMSETIRHRRDTPEALRAFAEELRAGSDAMCMRGWMRTLYGGKP